MDELLRQTGKPVARPHSEEWRAPLTYWFLGPVLVMEAAAIRGPGLNCLPVTFFAALGTLLQSVVHYLVCFPHMKRGCSVYASCGNPARL